MKRRRRNDREISGVLVLDKPTGITSHALVVRVRRAYGTSRVGHAGTLDPLASGVMVLLLGTATRVAEYLQMDDKEYRVTLLLGRETDTQDITGADAAGSDPARALTVTREELAAALLPFTGTFSQVPPVYSAIKVGGEALHRLARRGEAAPPPPREVTISRLGIESFAPPRAVLSVACSKGTYMRTLCHDIGRALATGGCLEALVRTRSGPFTLAEAIDPDRIASAADRDALLRDTPSALPFPRVEADQVDLAGLLQGRTIPWPGPWPGQGMGGSGAPPGGMAAVTRGAELVALGEVREEGGGERVLVPRKILCKSGEKC